VSWISLLANERPAAATPATTWETRCVAGYARDTPSKAVPDPVLGLAALSAIVRASPLTTVAIGGIDATNLPDVLAAGAENFAVIRAVNRASDPAAAIRALAQVQ